MDPLCIRRMPSPGVNGQSEPSIPWLFLRSRFPDLQTFSFKQISGVRRDRGVDSLLRLPKVNIQVPLKVSCNAEPVFEMGLYPIHRALLVLLLFM